MSTHLALGTVAALAGLAAASRRGSRAAGGRAGYSLVRYGDLSVIQGDPDDLEEVLWRENPLLVSLRAQDSRGGQRELSIHWRDLDDAPQEIILNLSDWSDEALRESVDEARIHFTEWLTSLRFPLTVWRGVRLNNLRDLDLSLSEHHHWTQHPAVAQGFAGGWHDFATGGNVGVVVSAQMAEPSLRKEDVVEMFDHFIRYSDGYSEPSPITRQQWVARQGAGEDAAQGQWEVMAPVTSLVRLEGIVDDQGKVRLPR